MNNVNTSAHSSRMRAISSAVGGVGTCVMAAMGFRSAGGGDTVVSGTAFSTSSLVVVTLISQSINWQLEHLLES